MNPTWSISPRKAMAGEFEICLPVAIAGEATAAALEALDLVQALEAQLSFFQPDSDISEINRQAADAAVEVEPRLFSLLQGAMQLGRDSGGAYDLTATPLWEAWGFARRAGAIPSPEQLAEARTLVGGQWVELDEARKTIRFLRRGVRLNLGSIGKGYAVDRAVEHLLAAGVSDFLVHGGYSSVAAHGSAAGRSGPTQLRGPGRSVSRIRCAISGVSGKSGCATGPWARRGRSSNRFAIGGGVMATSSPAHRLAGRRRAFRHGPGPHGRGGRRAFDRFLRHGARGRHELLRESPLDRRPDFCLGGGQSLGTASLRSGRGIGRVAGRFGQSDAGQENCKVARSPAFRRSSAALSAKAGLRRSVEDFEFSWCPRALLAAKRPG